LNSSTHLFIVVTPQNSDLLAVEAVRQYNECYDLAFAQQMKNKDIAEGGAKAVCLVDLIDISSLPSRNETVRKSVKAMVNTLLDLLLIEPIQTDSI
jgi:glutamate dehydrogenase